MSDKIRVLAWSEVTEPKSAYPHGIHGALAEYLNVCEGITAKTASINDPDQGVSENALDKTDVLTWFGHVRHGNVTDETVRFAHRRSISPFPTSPLS